jgi:hypothetical protein
MSMPYRLGRLAAFGGWVGVTTLPWYAYKVWRSAWPRPRDVEPDELPIVSAGPDAGRVLAGLFAAKRPAIIEGLSDRVAHLTPEYVRERYGADLVADAYSSSDPEHVFFPGEETLRISVAEMIDKIFVQPPAPLRYHARVREHVLADYAAPQVDGYSYAPTSTALWLSQPDHLTPLHLDYWHGLLTQVRGDKQVTLLPPRELTRLSLEVDLLRERLPNDPLTRYNDFHRAAAGDFPELRGASRYEHRLKEGQTLYVPPYWWHQVVSLEACVSFATRYNARLSEKLNPVLLPMWHVRSTMQFRSALTGLRYALRRAPV